MKIYYNPKLKEISRKLRKNGILSEVLLWRALKNKQVKGYTFARQKPIGEYIVDFYCSSLRLVIEIDGITHDFKIGDDLLRQKEIESMGLKFLRFKDSDIRNDLDAVVRHIEAWIDEN